MVKSKSKNMHYREITRSEIENNHWTILLKNNNSVLAIKGNKNPLCDECPNSKKSGKKQRFVTMLICDDTEITDKKKGYSYYKCVNSVNGCNQGTKSMIVGLQIA
jgi:hypothetical protein